MTKEEYLTALECLYDDDVFDREVLGFVREGDNLSCADVENAKRYYRDKIKKLIEEHFDTRPYKYEELKVGMWMWDDIYKSYLKIIGFNKIKGLGSCIYVSSGVGMYKHDFYIEFKENRFFPVTKVIQKEVEYNG